VFDGGSCIYFLLGCMDVLACNYDSLATQDDGSCILPDGCTDTTALNYDVTATCDDGSCIAAVYGCTDPNAWNYYPGANVNDPNNPCCYVAGCTDPLATNYDANACQDDASCTFTNCSLILGFTSLGNIGNCCYYVSTSTMSWTSADSMCTNAGGSMVAINSQQESDSFNILLGNTPYGPNSHWLGLIDYKSHHN
jgi:hypothetical protein